MSNEVASVEQDFPYLHDAIVESMSVEFGESNSVTLLLHCHPDCGRCAWDDQHLVVRFHDVRDFRPTILGYHAGGDSLDSASTRRPRDVPEGLTPAKQRIGISFHSGSEIDISYDHCSVGLDHR